ncbi:glycosyltransferase 87 family protein [Actinophytocola sp. KF-1]
MLPRVATAGVVVANVGVLCWFLLSFRHGLYVYRADLDVYRLGADAWLRGADLYGVLPPLRIGTVMPFTYPPIAAVLFTPLAAIPFTAASLVLSATTIVLVAAVLVVTLRALAVRASWLLVGALLPVALVTEPVRTTLYLGQVNVVLMALVVFDCLARNPRWPRGVLVGVAAAVKLTPAVFVLYFLVRGDRKAAAITAASFAGATGLGFLLAGRDSLRYWTTTVFDSDRIGGATRTANQSIRGLLARLGIESSAVWLVLCAALVCLTLVAMRAVEDRPVWTLGVNALGTLPLAPVSWSHHWVWCVPVLLAAGVHARRAAVGGLLLFVLSPHWWWSPDHEWTFWRLMTGNLYVCFAILVVAPRRGAAPKVGPGMLTCATDPVCGRV